VHARLGIAANRHSALIARDQASCADGLIAARELLRTGQARYAIVAGVDSSPHPRMLKHYIDQRRLMNSGNSNGFFPSEAGCAMLLALDDPSGRAARRSSASAARSSPLRAPSRSGRGG